MSEETTPRQPQTWEPPETFTARRVETGPRVVYELVELPWIRGTGKSDAQARNALMQAIVTFSFETWPRLEERSGAFSEVITEHVRSSTGPAAVAKLIRFET